MKRKDFFSAAALSVSSLAAFSRTPAKTDFSDFIIPPFLQQGDTVGITSAAGFITAADCEDCINAFRIRGYRVITGKTIGKKQYNFGGTDEERRDDLQQMLDDPSVKAIMIARGGYGINRIIDQLDFKPFRKNPKWLIGFSDVTVLHSHINSNLRVATIHAKMCNSFVAPQNADEVQLSAINSLWPCLSGASLQYFVLPNDKNRIGTTTGILTGGNLKTIESLLRTKSELDTYQRILFLEDTGEYLYSIDRMFRHLARAGALADLKGLIVGGFKIKPDEEGEAFGYPLEEIVMSVAGKYNYPVCFNFSVGHQKDNRALRCGAVHTLSVTENIVSLKTV